MHRLRRLGLMIVALPALAGCGGSGGGKPQLTVSAAASLKEAFMSYGRQFSPARTRFSFAGSDELAAQIRQGARPDVFASANTKLPEALHRAGLVDAPVALASNRLVIAVPTGSRKVTSLSDLEAPGVTIAAGSPSVPVGGYTRQLLARLPSSRGQRILANVRSNEPDVKGVVGKLTQGAVDAGFVYVTDVGAASGKLREIELPAAARPQVAYAVARVRRSGHAKQARAFIAGLLRGAGARALRTAGFEPPPGAR